METKTKKRALFVIAALITGIGLVLALKAFNDNIVFFFSPSQIVSGEAPVERVFRVGGIVKMNSVTRVGDGLDVRFVISDTVADVPVEYTGILPDLFSEGQGVVAEGRLDAEGLFRASRVLAKHDENYMPPEAAQALKQAHEKGMREAKKPRSGCILPDGASSE